MAAVAPTSAMICCAESTPRPGDLGEALHDVVMGGEQIGHLLIERQTAEYKRDRTRRAHGHRRVP